MAAKPVPCIGHVPRQISDAAATGADPPEAVVIGRQREASQAAGLDAGAAKGNHPVHEACNFGIYRRSVVSK